MLTKDEIVEMIEEAVVKSPYNNFNVIKAPEKPMWQKPIVGFAMGDNPYFNYYKKTIGDFYWLPKEGNNLKYKDEFVEDNQLTVISIGLPQTAETKSEQGKATSMPSDRWLYTRGEWEAIIAKIAEDIVAKIETDGYRAVSLDLSKSS